MNVDPFGDAAVPADPHHALELLERQASALYAAAAPKGMSPSGNERAYRQGRQQLEAILVELGIPSPFPWASLEECLAFYKAEISGQGAYACGRRTLPPGRRVPPSCCSAGSTTTPPATYGPGWRAWAVPLGVLWPTRRPSAWNCSGSRTHRSRPECGDRQGQELDRGHGKGRAHRTRPPGAGHCAGSSARRPALKALGLDRQTVASHDPLMAKILGQLNGLASGVADLRNAVGDGHGSASAVGLDLREGRLAARAAVAWCCFMIETLEERQKSSRTP